MLKKNVWKYRTLNSIGLENFQLPQKSVLAYSLTGNCFHRSVWNELNIYFSLPSFSMGYSILGFALSVQHVFSYSATVQFLTQSILPWKDYLSFSRMC